MPAYIQYAKFKELTDRGMPYMGPIEKIRKLSFPDLLDYVIKEVMPFCRTLDYNVLIM